MYVIDEPGRHLHPRLEREAAGWLKTFAKKPATQVVVATHSPRFLRLTRDVVWNFFTPRAGEPADPSMPRPSLITTFRPHEHDAFGSLAAIMGFDRGELLAGVELVLFVEGISDVYVLSELFGSELHAEGVAMFPYQGVHEAAQKGIVEAEILLHYTAADIAVLVDNASGADVHGLIHDSEFLDEACRSKARSIFPRAQSTRASRPDRQAI